MDNTASPEAPDRNVPATLPLGPDELAALQALLDAASEVFQRPVTPHDDFFGLGGDSVSAIELLTRMEEHFGHEIDEDTLFTAESFAAMAQAMARQGSAYW